MKHQSRLIFRSFNYLQLRTLLNLQDQLSALEKELDSHDGYGLPVHSKEEAGELSQGHSALMQTIEEKLERYSKSH